jgi:DnaJ domain
MPNLHPLSWLQAKIIGQPKPKSLSIEARDGVEHISLVMGRYAGRTLNDLAETDFVPLLNELSRLDPAAFPVIEKYLDRRFPGWREDMQANPHRWGLGGNGGDRRVAMSEDEAHEILGLAPGASAEAIRDAHRSLIKRLHPDQGGSTYLAARVNDAKAVLMKRHR